MDLVHSKESSDNGRPFSASSLEPTTTTFVPSAIISIPNAFIPPLETTEEPILDGMNPVNTEIALVDETAKIVSDTGSSEDDSRSGRPKTARGGRPSAAKDSGVAEDGRNGTRLSKVFLAASIAHL
jgi:hypothetical protein